MQHVLDAGPRGATAREKGFTLIELLVVMVIVPIMVGLLLPAVQKLRCEDNAATATRTLTEIRAAQTAFRDGDLDHDGVADYAGSLEELVAAQLLGEDLGDGRRQGYAFDLAPSAGRTIGYAYLGTPMNQGQTGVRGFGGDDSGLLPYDCPPGQHWEIARGDITCVSDEGPAVRPRLPLGELSGVAAVDAANLLADGAALDLARTLLSPELVDLVKAELDADGDRRIGFEELLGADLLAMARRLAPTQSVPGGGARLGDDAALDAILRRLQGRLRQELGLGTGDETELPSAPLENPTGSPQSTLDLASVRRTHASLTVLLDLLDGLDPAPAAGQMTSRDPSTNRERKRRLVASAEGMYSLWRSRSLAELRLALVSVRERADGAPVPEDWLKGSAARSIVARVDATLAYAGEEGGLP